jgi:hypothetical protein
MADLKNETPLREHLGHPAEKRVILPKSYIVTLTFRRKDRETLMASLPEMIKSCGAEILSDEIAQHEWNNRFKLMIVKRLGPSLVPAEVVIPLSSLGRVMEEIEEKIDQPVVKEGVIVREGRDGQPEVVILGFIPSDQRKLGYNFIFGLSLTIFKIAEKYGGRPYATGLYFSRMAGKILGEKKAAILKEFKKKTDPKAILSPRYGRWETGSPRTSGSAPINRCEASRRTSPGTLTAAHSAATASMSATSSTGAAGRARVRAASGTG